MLLKFGPTFIWTFVNLMLLYFLLKKLLFGRLTLYMDNRTKSIKESIDNAEKAKADAAELKKKYEDQLRSAKDEASKIIDEARSKANKEYDSIIADAKKDAEGVLVKAREEIERERDQMLSDIKGQVASLALAAASKVVEANMDTASNRALVDKFIDEAGAA
ncbi:MAG: F0F1 ATP synthase subunit B [Clostridia bacterium]|nr:F0F1 ATP synthase subunit B [Clostridia bacterium]